MRFRIGLMFGFCLGYYLGAKAGRERYQQINQWLDKAKGSGAYATATEKAKAVVDLGMERAREFVEEHRGNGTPADVAGRDAPLIGGP